MLDALRELETKAQVELESAGDSQALQAWNQAYLGRKGALAPFFLQLRDLPREERPQAGQALNQVKQALTAALEERQAALKAGERAAAMAAESIDVTLPGRPPSLGRLHPSTATLRRPWISPRSKRRPWESSWLFISKYSGQVPKVSRLSFQRR